MRKSFCVWCAIMLVIGLSITQVSAQSKRVPSSSTALRQFQTNQPAFREAQFGDNYYVDLTFTQLPTENQRLTLSQSGIELLSFQEGTTYRAAITKNIDKINFNQLGINKLGQRGLAQKVAPAIINNHIPHHAQKANQGIEVAILFHTNISTTQINTILSSVDAIVTEDRRRGGKTIIATITKNRLEKIAAHPAVDYLDIVEEPVQLLNEEVRNQQGINLLNSSLGDGYDLRGAGVTVGVGDGGELGDHLDFDDRVFNEANGSYSSFGDHGDHVAGMIGGGGRINERHRGIAPECELVIQKTSLITYYAPDYFDAYEMVLTNGSYGTSFNCDANGAYNYTSQSLDAQLRSLPKMLHVFAAGNSGNRTCDPYPKGYRSVLRYYQSAKNVLTVGNLREDRTINASSSRGPVLDGRLKPEICGIGSDVYSTGRDYNYRRKSGTSMASPAVVGTLALLNQAYRRANNEELPDGALLKAIACNTADDLGNPGPDYIFGFGLINGPKAVDCIENQQFSDDEISHDEIQNQVIEVPEGLNQLNIMLYWPDVEGGINTPKALVNDLDLEIIDPSGAVVLPWVLDPTSEGVELAAIRGVDTINNIEQVTIKNPVAGTYTIRIKGSAIPSGPQNYYTTYFFEKEEMNLTFPLGGESFEPGNKEMIRWDAPTGNTSPFHLQYTADDGALWTTIATDIDAAKRNYLWTVPSSLTTNGKIRISTVAGGQPILHQQPFSIQNLPTNFTINTYCEGVLELNWNGEAPQYELCYYNGSEMSVLDTTSAQNFLIDQGDFEIGTEYWFALRAIAEGGMAGNRITAIPATPQLEGECPWANDLSLQSIAIRERGREATSSALSNEEPIGLLIKNLGTITAEGFTVSYRIDNNTVITETITEPILSGDSLVHYFGTPINAVRAGTYQIDAWIHNELDTRSVNDSIIGITEVEQLANPAVSFRNNNLHQQEFEQATVLNYEQSTLGLAGISQWDYSRSSYDSELNLNNGTESAQLMPGQDGNSPDYSNDLVWTVNLDGFSRELGDLALDFEYLSDTLSPLSFPTNQPNEVFVRGNDQAEWIKLKTLGGSNNEWVALANLNISEVLAQANQSLTSSFQIRFSQRSESGLTINNPTLQQLSSLPVQLLSFTAQRMGKDALLQWDTASESFNDYFDIELAIGDEAAQRGDFQAIGRVRGNGTTNIPQHYVFRDTQAIKAGNRYYRLRQVDFDGAIEFSPVRVVYFAAGISEVQVYPNPFCRFLKIHYQAPQDQTITLLLEDMTGQVVSSTKHHVAVGNQEILLDFVKHLTAGNYVLRIPEDKFFRAHRVIKIRE